jgi:hypothetical protein
MVIVFAITRSLNMRELSLDDLFFGLEEGRKYDIYVEGKQPYTKNESFIEYKIMGVGSMQAIFSRSRFELFDLRAGIENSLLTLHDWRFLTEE